MSELDDVVNRFRRDLRREEAAAQKSMRRAYRAALASLRNDLAASQQRIRELEAAGEPIKRWRILREAQIRQLIARAELALSGFGVTVNHDVVDLQRRMVERAQEDAIRLIEAGFGPGPIDARLPVVRLPERAIVHLVGALQPDSPLARVLDDFAGTSASVVADQLIAGMAAGTNSAVLAREIARRSGAGIVRAETIARTEMHRAYRAASLEVMRANRHLLKGWRWSSARDDRTCPVCLALDGRIFPIDTPMKAHVNCFPAGVVVGGPPVVGSTTRWYDGDLVEIRFASGAFLPVTPNHPVLTPHGWVAAGALHEGGDVLRCLNPERVAATINPDNDHRPAVIEDVAEAFGRPGSVASVRVPTTAEDFHGDGACSEVCVVRTDGLLGDAFDPALSQPFLQEQFGGRHMGLALLPGAGALTAALDRIFLPAAGGVGRDSETSPFFRGDSRHPNGHAIGSITRCDACGQKMATNNVPTHRERRGDSLFRLADFIAADDFFERQLDHAHRVPRLATGEAGSGLRVAEHSAGFERITQALVAGVEPSGDNANAIAIEIRTDRILEINVRRFSGHVYNLQTTRGWYIANGIITHNCRCSAVPVTKSWQDLGFDVPSVTPVRQTGAAWFRQQPAATKRKILDPAAYRAYQAGRVDLADFIRLDRNREWGDAYVRGSLKESLRRAQARRSAA